MKKICLVFGILLVLAIGLVSAHEHNREDAKALIDSKASCDELSDEQLEMIGEYYMEQMHPGEQHELMDKMMGGEGSESLKQMHIQMAKILYCGESSGMMDSGSMMNMMMAGGNMMGSGGMMNMAMGSGMMGNFGYGMMGNLGYNFGYWNFVDILYVILLIGLIILVYLWIVKLWRYIKKGGKK